MLVPNTSGERSQTLNLVTIYLIVTRGQLAWRDMCRCAGVQEWWLLRLPTSGAVACMSLININPLTLVRVLRFPQCLQRRVVNFYRRPVALFRQL